MPERTSVATDAAGRRMMAKVAGDADEAVRLEREAAQLESARHPGVVDTCRRGMSPNRRSSTSTPRCAGPLRRRRRSTPTPSCSAHRGALDAVPATRTSTRRFSATACNRRSPSLGTAQEAGGQLPVLRRQGRRPPEGSVSSDCDRDAYPSWMGRISRLPLRAPVTRTCLSENWVDHWSNTSRL
jgi:hypothetical protein